MRACLDITATKSLSNLQGTERQLSWRIPHKRGLRSKRGDFREGIVLPPACNAGASQNALVPSKRKVLRAAHAIHGRRDAEERRENRGDIFVALFSPATKVELW